MSVISSLAAAALSHDNTVKQRFFGSVDIRYNTLVCGGGTGTLAEQRAQRLILAKMNHAYRNHYPSITLVQNRNTANGLYEKYGDAVTIYGLNRNFNPFDICHSADDIAFILGRVADESHRTKHRAGNPSDIRLWSDMIASILQMYRCPLSYSAADNIVSLLFTSSGMEDFCRTIAAETGQRDLPSSLKQSLNRLWNRSLNEFQHFWNEFSRQTEMLHSPRETDPHSQIIVYLPETDSELTKAALFAEWQLLCRYGVSFTLLSIDVPLGEEALPLFSEYSDRVTFGIYTRYIDRIRPCFVSLTANLENMVCLGVNGHDADTLLQSYSSQTPKWMPHIEANGIGAGKGFVPNYTAADFMPGRIADGGAMIYTRSKGRFEKAKVFL